MILSFTKDVAKLFNLKLKLSHSDRYKESLALDDWVMGVFFSNEHATGVYLIHRHSLLVLFVVANKLDLSLCLGLFHEQLQKILNNLGLGDAKYVNYFDNLFHELISVKHNNLAITREMRNLQEHFYWFNEKAHKAKKKTHSIDFVNEKNNEPRTKFDFKTSFEVFKELVQKHYTDPILITDNHPDFNEHNKTTIH